MQRCDTIIQNRGLKVPKYEFLWQKRVVAGWMVHVERSIGNSRSEKIRCVVDCTVWFTARNVCVYDKDIITFSHHGLTAPSGPGPPHYRSFTIIFSDKTQPSQQRDIHAPAGIRTNNLSKRAATHPCLRPRVHWHRQNHSLLQILGCFFFTSSFVQGPPSPHNTIRDVSNEPTHQFYFFFSTDR